MSIATKSRSVLIFEEYLQSERTTEYYAYHINRFAKYFDLPSWNSNSNCNEI